MRQRICSNPPSRQGIPERDTTAVEMAVGPTVEAATTAAGMGRGRQLPVRTTMILPTAQLSTLMSLHHLQ